MNTISENIPPSTQNIKDTLKVYTKYWIWFVFSAFITLSLAFMYLRYTIPEYSANAMIQLVEGKNSSSELSIFKDLDILSGGSNEVEDEIQIIKSRSNFIEVVKQLGLNKKIISLGNIKNTELYEEQPFKINFIAPDSVIHNSNFTFIVNLSSKTTFGYTEDESEPFKEYAYGKTITSPIGEMVITPNSNIFSNFNKENRFEVVVSAVHSVAQQYKKNVSITSLGKLSNIVNVSLKDPIQKKAEDIIRALIAIYNSNGVEDKRMIANKTSEFINDRISEIYSDLSISDQNAEDFKTGRGLTDITSQANINLTTGVSSQKDLQFAEMQLNIASSMKDIVENQEGFEVLPANIGLSNPSIINTTARYNQLVAERKRLLKSSNDKNPVIVNLDQELEGLKNSVNSSLNSIKNNLNLQVNTLSKQLSSINSKIYSAPKHERALRDITRQQQTTESLYLYLLQKREESQITFASATPKSKIIEEAFGSSPYPVSPKKNVIYLASLILGLLIPFSIIYVFDLFDNKIHSKVGLEKIVGEVPVLAELPKLSRKEDKLVKNIDRSVLAESLRILRTNLDYIIKSKNTITGAKNNLIFVTSSVSGEGKTFLSSNLAMIFASTKKKVLLIGADIRNPKLYTFFSNNMEVDNIGRPRRGKNVGLTEFLFDDSLSINEIINPILVNDNMIDVIYSGKIPPNPSELLLSERMKQLFKNVSQNYDYVVVDTAPLLVVTDTLLISKYASQILYVTKAGVTENEILEFPLKLKKEGKLKNLSFIVNNVKTTDLGYGGKYGYGYGKTTKKWWKF